ncbi:hypothetical protein MMC22_004055 [Lobaria immixta]|nr:hypothetical protein [Lobaria immixta]
MDEDLLPPDATAKEIEELAIEMDATPLSRTLPQSSSTLDKNSSKAAVTKAAGPLRFTDTMDVAMYEAMVEAHRKGLRGEPAGFKPAAWKRIVAAVQAQITTGQIVTKKQFEGRKATQKTKWAEWKRLGTLSGWVFDYPTGLFVASDEQWDREIQEFDELFGGRVAIGDGAQLMDDILAESEPFDVDRHAAPQVEGVKRYDE